MALLLSPTELAQLSAAVHVLTTPLAYERLADWRAALRSAVEPLLGVHLSGTVLPIPGESLAEGTPGCLPPAQSAHVYFSRFRPGLAQAEQPWEIACFCVGDICEWAEPIASDVPAAPARPRRLYDAVAMVVKVGATLIPAAAHFFRERTQKSRFAGRAVGILQILVPAFAAGMNVATRLVEQRASLARVVDGLRQGLLIFDAEGQLLHANPALQALVAPSGGHALVLAAARRLAERLAHAARSATRDLGLGDGAIPAVEELRAGPQRLRLWGSYLGPGAFAPGRCIIEVVEQIAAEPLGRLELRGRFRLTERECQVAQALALGRTNREIAAALAIRERTAEHHTEHVLLKLGVHSRAAAGAVLRGVPRDPERAEPRAGVPCDRLRTAVAGTAGS
ncbi:MAG TPA: LuxR C-terminal-related transcriptional regulator [Gemmatimonadales bacterium]|nr:LuxR C-terminal-related transcriptional regulator [Gemmatimonadales bacterium]